MKIQLEDIYKATFVTWYGLYEYTVVSFGLTNASMYFMNIMNKVFMDEWPSVSLSSLTTY
jgi:hypothetical protein